MNLNVIQDKPKNQATRIKSILAIAASKGGVGKSTLAVNLALCLQKRGLKVGVLDADVYGPSLEQMLPAGMEPVEFPGNVEKLLPALAFGIPYISVAHFRKGAQIVRAPIANQIIEQFLSVIEWGDLDHLIIDFPPGTGDIQLTLMQQAEISSAIVVTTPQQVATLDVRKAIELFQTMQIPVLGVVENMSYLEIGNKKLTPFGRGGAEELAREFSLPLLGQIPIDESISKAGDLGKSLFEMEPNSGGALSLNAIANSILEEEKKLQVSNIEVRQVGSKNLEIFFENTWRNLPLHKAQLHCPCAACKKQKNSDPNVSLLEISPVGRYAIKITFSSGCSQGIYPYTLLAEIV